MKMPEKREDKLPQPVFMRINTHTPCHKSLKNKSSFGNMELSLLCLPLFLLLASDVVLAGDPDITSDFILPSNATAVDGSFFTFTGLHKVVAAGPGKEFTVTKASLAEFPALNGQSVSMAVLSFPAGSVNAPHTHPRAAELLFLLKGKLEVGVVDTANKLFTQTLQPGDAFVFPKGLVHFQFCNSKNPALAISAFGSSNAGTVSLPKTVFTSGIDVAILAKSFKTDVATVEKIKAGLA